MLTKYGTGITVGVFDLFHTGHLNLLERCKAMCNRLVVAVCDDDYVRNVKHTEYVHDAYSRMRIVSSIKCVDEVISCSPAEAADKTLLLNKCKFDVLFSGDDWKGSKEYAAAKKRLDLFGIPIEYLPYTKGVSTTEIKRAIAAGVGSNPIDEVPPPAMSIEEVQARSLKMLKLIASKCDELGVPWFVSDGTLLGAVRHDGFIPWDDDVDIWVPDGDAYDTLMRHYSDFKYPCILQNEYSESNWLHGIKHGQMHDLSTTGVTRNIIINGVFLDVFPFADCGNGMVRNKYLKTTPYPKEWWSKYTLHKFEDMLVRIPVEYDRILTKEYGDWRTQRRYTPLHGHPVWYAIPYERYVRRLGKRRDQYMLSSIRMYGHRFGMPRSKNQIGALVDMRGRTVANAGTV